MYGKIVVPLDSSKQAEVALPYAEELAGRMGSEIILLSVLETAEPHVHQNHRNYIDKVIETTKDNIVKRLAETRDKEIKVWSATRVGYPAEGIVDYAEKLDVGLIIMATHGRSGVSRWALGSVADKVVRANKRQPLLLIRAKGARPDVRNKGILNKVLVPADGSIASEVVIPYIRELASKLEAELTLLRVVSPANQVNADAEDYLESKCSLFRDAGITTRYEVRTGAVADEIIKFADEINADLVAMSTHGRSGVSRWVLGSVAEKVLQGGTTPLMLVAV